MAAYVSTTRKWAAFERAASPLLNAYDVGVIHGTKLWASKQAFDGWTKERKVALIRDLAKLMKRYVLFGFTVTLDDDAYNHIIKTRPAGTPDSEYATCFRVCMLHIPRFIKDFGIDIDPRVHFVVEDGHPNLEEAFHLFEVSQAADPTLNRQLLSINKADKEKFVATQLADLLAYLSYRHAREFVARGIMLPASPLLEELCKGARVYQHFFNDRELAGIKLALVAEHERVSKLTRAQSKR